MFFSRCHVHGHLRLLMPFIISIYLKFMFEVDLNPFPTKVPILFPRKVQKNLCFFGAFMGHKIGTLVRNGLISCDFWCYSLCVCVFISFHRKGFWLNKTNGNKQRRYTEEILLYKYLCRLVIDNHSRNLQTNNCSKECQSNRAESREVKDNSYTFQKPSVKARNIATFLLTKLGSRSSRSTRANIGELHFTERGALTR